MKKCGLIFNRHKWKSYYGNRFRICEKCGECQYYLFAELGEGWVSIPFTRFKAEMAIYEASLKEEEKSNQESLKFLEEKEK